MNTAQDLYDHYKAVRARMGIVPQRVTVTIPEPKITFKKAKKNVERDIIYLYAPTPVIKFKPNETPDELFDSHDVKKFRLPYIREIVDLVCQEFGVERGEVLGAHRSPRLTRPRLVVYYLARHCSFKSTTEIGRALGGRDHSTITHGINKIGELILRDDALYTRVNRLRRRLTVESLAHRYWGA